MPLKKAAQVLDFFRAWPLAAIGAVLVLFALVTDLARLDLLIWGVTKVAVLAYAGYWIDRWLFPYARPHDWWWGSDLDEDVEPLTAEEMRAMGSQPIITPIPQIRRAIIIAACILVAVLIP